MGDAEDWREEAEMHDAKARNLEFIARAYRDTGMTREADRARDESDTLRQLSAALRLAAGIISWRVEP